MKKYLVELDENLVKYIRYIQDDVNDGSLTTIEEYLEGYKELLSQLSNNLECVDDNLSYFTAEELNLIHGLMHNEQGWGLRVYSQEDLDNMKRINSVIESFKGGGDLNISVKSSEDEPHHIANAELDEAIECANAELAECIEMIHNCKNLQEVWEKVDRGENGMSFGNDDYSDKDYIGICYKSIQFDVMSTTDGIMIAGDKVMVFNDENQEIWTGTLNEEGVKGVESQDELNIYLKPDEPEQSTNNAELDEEDDFDDVRDFYEDESGEQVYMLNSTHYIHINVDKSYDQLSWVLYDEHFKPLAKNWTCGTDADTVVDIFETDLTQYIGKGKCYLCSVSPTNFKHLLNA